ncbi:MAG: serine--tRNA ligase [Candidatus Portnoybacteria bacterium CG10_big_fil_rev_8_21_14_0_10_36_7]|uniref:Serine--tRNA ligase n=1 Tax=Candidatus Portnoybacteria bacterium CG10_big_fil_rev_8_21_14_0_10_36_7 TaxID=1974812 RepID=A0A2M8KE07_9BACT|nr:MAG: serine--tRNA ligase [Candidatus Portnoybacteria bacterium CG10_big_fil_rev_8_21_14_0_10_36_7]
MIDIKIIRENPDKVKKAMKDRGKDFGVVDEVLRIDEEYKKLLIEFESLKAEQNKVGKKPSFDELESLKSLKIKLGDLTPKLNKLELEIKSRMEEIPNIQFVDVPVGVDESANKEVRQWGQKPEFDFEPKDYMELGEELDVIDTKRAVKISGSRFGFLKGEAVLMEFKLINMAVDFLVSEGFTPILPPVMVSEETMKRTGHLTKNDAREKYFLPEDNMILVGSSEQSILPMHADEVFEETNLPRRYVGFSTCFRREAGSYGKDTKGILRVHQFDKVEMISYVKPEDSEAELDYLVSLQENIIQKLGLHYRMVANSTGDMGVTAARQYDIEVWMPSQNKYRETNSASNCTDYQTRRLNIKYKNKETGRNEFVHALNATAMTQRPLIALIENYQTKDGKVNFPKL